MDRRTFLAALASPLLASCEFSDGHPDFSGELLGPDMGLGHRLRNPNALVASSAATEMLRIPIAIIGGGIGGLSAAWRLARSGNTEFRLFEMEPEPGGNARSGANEFTPYPWGAHYLPLPTLESRSVRTLLADLGVLRGDVDATAPSYDERYLVHEPRERLYFNGLWQEGLLPRFGVAQRDLDQYRRFDELVEKYKTQRPSDGRKLFAIPSLLSGFDSDSRALDRISMHDWMLARGFDSPFLHWYVNYGCRDDYGTLASGTSAWAGMHYHACRDGLAAHADPHSVLTWPEGNGWLVQRMIEWLRAHHAAPVQSRALCTRVVTNRTGAEIDFYLAAEQRTIKVHADQVIWAAPSFILAQVWENPPAGLRDACARVEYAPWLVANLTLDGLPEDSGPAGPAWDNVFYGSSSLGYVVATHQAIRVKPGPTVLTWYRPLTEGTARDARLRLANTGWKTWVDEIVAELARPHPALPAMLKRIDLWRWGHAMPRPVPGFLSLPLRRMLAGLDRPLSFAHSDLSGLSLFEEAHYAGVRAAEKLQR